MSYFIFSGEQGHTNIVELTDVDYVKVLPKFNAKLNVVARKGTRPTGMEVDEYRLSLPLGNRAQLITNLTMELIREASSAYPSTPNAFQEEQDSFRYMKVLGALLKQVQDTAHTSVTYWSY